MLLNTSLNLKSSVMQTKYKATYNRMYLHLMFKVVVSVLVAAFRLQVAVIPLCCLYGMMVNVLLPFFRIIQPIDVFITDRSQISYIKSIT